MRAFRLCFFIILVILSQSVTSQNIDSLKAELDTKDLIKKSDAMRVLAERYKFENVDSAIIYADQLILISEQNIRDEIKIENLVSASRVYDVGGYFYSSLDGYQKALQLAEKTNSVTQLRKIYHNLGNLYFYIDEYNLSTENFKKSLEMSEKAGDSIGMANSLHALGDNYRIYDKFDSSQYYLNKSLDLHIKHMSHDAAAIVAFALCETFNEINEFDKTLEMVDIMSKYKDEFSMYTYNYMLYVEAVAKYWIEESGLNNDTRKYIETIETIVSEIQRVGNYNAAVHIMPYLLKILENEENYMLAYYYKSKMEELRVENFTNRKMQTFRDLEMKYEVKVKENQIQLQEATLQSKNFQIYSITAFLIISVILSVVVFKSYQNQRKLNLLLNDKNAYIEILIKELHHRVKNNLQVVSSLLGLQSMKLANPESKEAMLESKNRIQAMSLVHKLLYLDDNISVLNIREFIENLVNELQRGYGKSSAKFNLDIEERKIDAEKVFPIGLIINELIINSFKYALNTNEILKISIEIQLHEELLEINYSDNGIIKNDVSDEESTSFGGNLINLMVTQLKGEIIKDEESFKYNIKIPRING